MATKWKPLGGTEWLQQPDWLLDDPLPDHPVTTPRKRRGLPEHRPYRYRGSDYSEPAETTVTARPARWIVREATALDDPYLRYAGLPFSRPWNYNQGEL